MSVNLEKNNQAAHAEVKAIIDAFPKRAAIIVAIATIAIVGAIFLILAAEGVLPVGLNAISQMGIFGDVMGAFILFCSIAVIGKVAHIRYKIGLYQQRYNN